MYVQQYWIYIESTAPLVLLCMYGTVVLDLESTASRSRYVACGIRTPFRYVAISCTYCTVRMTGGDSSHGVGEVGVRAPTKSTVESI